VLQRLWWNVVDVVAVSGSHRAPSQIHLHRSAYCQIDQNVRICPVGPVCHWISLRNAGRHRADMGPAGMQAERPGAPLERMDSDGSVGWRQGEGRPDSCNWAAPSQLPNSLVLDRLALHRCRRMGRSLSRFLLAKSRSTDVQRLVGVAANGYYHLLQESMVQLKDRTYWLVRSVVRVEKRASHLAWVGVRYHCRRKNRHPLHDLRYGGCVRVGRRHCDTNLPCFVVAAVCD